MSSDPIAVAHARELLADLEANPPTGSERDMAYAVGQLTHTVRALLEVVDENGGEPR